MYQNCHNRNIVISDQGNTIKRILLAVCGGIAAYKSAQLVRLFNQRGAETRVLMTRSAQQFITPLTLQALSGNPVHTELLDCETENAMGHIQLSRWADILIVAPATANAIAKFSCGLADDLLSTLYLAATCPVYIAPAMNQAMWRKPVTRENIRRLQQQGVTVLGPAYGEQACGDSGPGRMLEPSEICRSIFTGSELLKGVSVLVSAGPTREPLDPVRFISNRSSGKMGYAIADAASRMGASVTLVSGPVNLPPPKHTPVLQVETAEQMYEAVIVEAEHHDIYIGAAAVADYSPIQIEQQKIKKEEQAESLLRLRKTKDILADVAALQRRPFTVGFAAETQHLEQYALDKLRRKKLDMIAANLVGQATGGFDNDLNALTVYWQNGFRELPLTDKRHLAEQLLTLIAEKFNEKRTTKNTG